MNVVIIICLAYMLALFVAAVVRFIFTSRKNRLKYIKNFKRGGFALIYVAIFPIYFLAYLYNGEGVGGAFWQTIKIYIDIIVLRFDYTTVAGLMAANQLYFAAVHILFTLVSLNGLIFIFSLCGLHAYNAISLYFTRKFRKKVVIVVGNNANSLDILASIKKENGKAVLFGEISSQMREDAFNNYADCENFTSSDDLGEKIARMFGKFDRKRVSVILNCENDSQSLLYVKQLSNVIADLKLTQLPLASGCGLFVYVLGSRANESTFVHYVEKSQGFISFVNRHLQIAMDFTDKYPLTQFMTDKQLDKNTATIKDDVNLNVFMLGFGNLNETLFLTSVSNNQFVTMKNGKLQPKAVNYHIYDRNYPEGRIAKDNDHVHSRSLNHGYLRYEEFLKKNKDKSREYLEFVPSPAEVMIHPFDFSHPDFYSSLYSELANENNYSYIIVSFGTDLENVELAEKLQQKLREWNIGSFVKIFVKVRDTKLVKEIKTDFENKYIEIFGTNKEVVYNASKILNEKAEQMARLKHILYTAEYEKKEKQSTDVSLTDEGINRAAREKWYSYKQFQRESNIFACLSIRMKLQLLGYDYAVEGEDCSSKFEEEYQRGNQKRLSSLTVDGKQISEYTNAEQFVDSVRWTYAVQEHQRWCANMICNGVVPASRAQILEDGGRRLDQRVHGNLTTMDGLVEFRKIVAKKNNKTEEQTDVIRYDYQAMDDVVWLLHKCGYKLIEKQ